MGGGGGGSVLAELLRRCRPLRRQLDQHLAGGGPGEGGQDTLEGMHRTAFHERGRSPAAFIPWLSANSALPENLQFYDEVVSVEGGEALFTFAWERSKCLLQKPGEPTSKARDSRWRFRPKRISDKRFYKQLCRVGSDNLVDWAALHVGARSSDVASTDIAHYDGDVFAGLSRNRCLMIQGEYVSAVLKQLGRGYYKLTLNGQTHYYHLLSPISPSKKYVRTNHLKVKMSVPYLAYKLEVLGAASSVYPFEDASRIDVLSIAPFPTMLNSVEFCKVGVSKEGGCVDILSSTPAKYLVAEPQGLLSDECPEYLVVKALTGAGWTASRGAGLRDHPSDQAPPARFLWPRESSSMKPYLQVLLALPMLRDKGLAIVHLRQPLSYYRLLMSSPRPGEVPPALSDRDYKKALQELQSSGQMPLLALLPPPPPVPPPPGPPPPVEYEIIQDDADDDDGIIVDEPPKGPDDSHSDDDIDQARSLCRE